MGSSARIALKIKMLRESKGLSQERLAALSGFRKAHMSKIERDARVASVDALIKIGQNLDVELDLVDTVATRTASRLLDVGVTDCYDCEDEAKVQIQSDVGEAKDIKLLLIRGRGLLGKGERSVLTNLLVQKGADSSVKILLLDPESKYLEIVSEIQDSYQEALALGIKKTLSELAYVAAKTKASFEYCVYDDFPLWRLLFADDKVFIAGYSKFAEPGGASKVHYRIQRRENPLESLFLPFELHFDHLWTYRSRPWPSTPSPSVLDR